MTWGELGRGWWRLGKTPQVPSTPLTEGIRRGNHYPATITTVAAGDVTQHLVFDPSMKQHEVALRASEPQFADRTQGARWYAARRTATAAVLSAVADSEFSNHLVLRGSILLKTWFGEAAREPGDLDFVIDSDHWKLTDPRTDRLFDEIARGADDASRRDDVVRIDASAALSDEIWTYDRVPGRRLVLPFKADGCPEGSIQLDFVFGELLPEPPQPIEIAADGGDPVILLAATPELSLAWKLLWLASDMYPQAKDLYDAVLLAESTPLRYELLQKTFVAADGHYCGQPVTMETLRTEIDSVDWTALRADYPHWELSEDALRQRLLAAVGPTFADTDIRGTDYQQRVRWLTPLIERCRRIRSEAGIEKMHAAMISSGARFIEAIVIAREVDGAENISIEDAADRVLATQTWQEWANGLLRRNPKWVADAIEAVRAAETSVSPSPDE
ncbi:nucleotidyl transferase AbiEii/AbiGii toxin family protein [Catenulispora subtropica]|uniref:Nucleotidyl transferase AbiEii/AbiGii toxin family protein n=1 Tax=Catenulispora subtropica TaxID=450798 RepID=A0ABP5DLX2_9ACTN